MMIRKRPDSDQLKCYKDSVSLLKRAGKKLGDVGDVGAKILQRFSSPTFLPGPMCSTKKVGDMISPMFLNSNLFTWKVKERVLKLGDVGARILRRFSSPTFLSGPMCSTKKVGDMISPTFLNSDLFTWKVKERVLKKAREVRPNNIKFAADLSQKTLDKRAAQIDDLKAARSAGKTAFFILDRLVIKDKPPDSQSVTGIKMQSPTAAPAGHSDEENEISFGTPQS